MKMSASLQTFACLFGLVVLASCSPTRIGGDLMTKIKEGRDYLSEKTKHSYQSSKRFLGLEDEPSIVANKPLSVSVRIFGELPDGEKIREFRLVNQQGMEVSVIEYGAAVREVVVPDREGKMENVSLGFSNLQDYLDKSPYFGCIAGRYANRIAGGRFALDGKQYQLALNNGPNHLHGGEVGFDKRAWSGSVLPDSLGARFVLDSPDGEEGYPGKMRVVATYELTENNELKVLIEATSDKKTVVNLTNHAYYNLAGEGDATILDHVLTLPGATFVATDETNVPIALRPVVGTPMDFRQPAIVGSRIEEDHPQLIAGKGYDHTWVVPDEQPSAGKSDSVSKLNHAATLSDPGSGRVMKLFTDQPGVQFYSGNYLDGSLVGDGGEPYLPRSGLCLEPQVYPDSPNHQGERGWPPCILNPGETYRHLSVYQFLAE